MSARAHSLLPFVWFLAAVALPPSTAFAAEPGPFERTAAQLLAEESPSSPADIDIEVLRYDVRFEVDAEGRLTTVRYMRYRLLTDDGASRWGSTGASYDPWHENKPTIRARVITKDGKEYVLNPATLVDAAASSQGENMYSTRRQLTGPLPAVRAGAVVEEQVVISEHRPYFEAGQVLRHVVQPGAFTKEWSVQMKAPATLPVRYRLRGDRRKPRRAKRGGMQTLTFVYRDQKPVLDWPARTDPDVAVVPVIEFSYGKSWGEVAKSYAAAVEAQLEGFDAKTLADAVVEAGDDRQQKIAKLTRYVHDQVRYTGLELGERSLIPAPPRESLERHYGDCKDKATLLVGLLRSQGIEAHVALLSAGTGLDVPHKLPGLGLFNHAIVHVPGREPLWIDATADKAPVGTVPYGDQDRLALVARPGTRKLERIPRMAAAENEYREDVHVRIVDVGKAHVTEVTSGTGAIGSSLRSNFDDSEGSLEKRFASYAEERFDGKLVKAATENTLRFDGPARLTLEIDEAGRYETGLKGGYAGVDARGLFSQLDEVLYGDDEEEEKRKQREKRKSDEKDPRFRYLERRPVYVEAHRRIIAFHFELPAGFAFEGLPGPLELTHGGLRLWRRVQEPEEGRLLVEYGIEADQRLVPVDDIQAVQNVTNRYWDKTAADIRYVYRPQFLIEQGQVTAGLAASRALQKANPDDFGVHFRHAVALIELGFGAEARAAAKRLTRRFPDNARAHWTLGWVHLFDTMGRDSWPGADFALAEKAFEKARALDEEERLYWTALRAVYSTGPDGGSLSVSPEVRAKLLTVLEQERERFGDESLDEEIARQHLWLHQYEDALRVVDEMQPSPYRDALWVASLAGAKGFDAARRKAIELGEGDPRTLLNGAAGVLALMDAVDLAATLGMSAEALRGNPSRASLEQFYTAMRDRDACVKAMPPAARAVYDFVLPFVSRLDGPAKLSQLPEGAKLPPHADVEAIRERLSATRRAMGDKEGSWLLAARATACLNEWDVEEVDGAIRVRVHPKGTPSDKTAETWYVMKKGRGFQVMAPQQNGRVTTLGRLAMASLRNRDERAARQWLRWSDELMAPITTAREHYSTVRAVRDVPVASIDDASTSELWLTAALRSAWSPMGAPEERALSRALKKAKDPQQRFAIQYVLAWALARQGKFDEAASLMDALRAQREGDRGLWRATLSQLVAAERFEEAAALLPPFKAAFPDDEEFARGLGRRVAEATGHYVETQREMQEKKERGEAKAGDLNDVAWSALFFGGDLEVAAQLCEESVRLESHFGNEHTMATLYVELGEYDKAHQHLQKVIQRTQRGGDDSVVWYTLARLSERMSLDTSAEDAFARVEKPDIVGNTSTWKLYERAMKRRKGAGARAKVSTTSAR